MLRNRPDFIVPSRLRRSRAAFLGAAGASLALAFAAMPSAEAKIAPRPVPAAATVAIPDIDVDLAYEKFTLPNGLRVIVHTDKKAPVVAFGVWYHVGSKDERPGRTGFAHLFEHLMFQGTENFKGEWFEPFENAGATDQNGTTWFDRTNYFETVPKTALDLMLWLESDRMGHFLNSIDQKKLDEQRAVVKNEKRQGDNQPYGRIEYSKLSGLFPAGHPYSWSTIGSLEDLSAASVADVKEWFSANYGPSNAVVVLAGDIDVAEAKTLMAKYFGDIPAGPPVTHRVAAVPTRQFNTRDRLEDNVPQVLLERSWATPGDYTKDAAYLAIASRILGVGKSSRLYKALVIDSPVATQVSFDSGTFEIASMPSASVFVKDGVEPAAAEATLDKALAEFRTEGPSADELARAKIAIISNVARSLEKVGGFGGQTVTLGESELYGGDPGAYKKFLGWVREATAQDVKAFAQKWLGDGWHQVDVVPVPAYATSGGGADRSHLPVVGTTPDLAFPAIETATLSNGVKVHLARRKGSATVDVSLAFDAGFAADSNDKAGLDDFTLTMLEEGTTTRDTLAITNESERLGAQLSQGSSLDLSTVGVSALKANLAPSLELLADIVRNPAFNAADFDRVKRQRLAAIGQEKADPQGLAIRLLPPALYGSGHPYGKPLSSFGTEAALQAISIADLRAFKDKWLRPDNVEIFAVGDVSLGQLSQALEQAFAGWRAPALAKGVKTIAKVAPKGARVAIVDRPDSPQTFILAGRLTTPSNAPNDIAFDVANDVFGGAFTSRINLNLREDKGWSYGSFSFAQSARGQRPFLLIAPVQTDKTAESLVELKKEIAGYLGDHPPTGEEIARARRSEERSLPGRFETNQAVLGQMISDFRFGRRPDYVTTLAAQYRAVTDNDVRAATKDVVQPNDLVWIVVGDAKKIEAGVKAAGLGPVEHWDADGRRLD